MHSIASQSSRRAVQRGQHGSDMLVEEQHRRDDDVRRGRCPPCTRRAQTESSVAHSSAAWTHEAPGPAGRGASPAAARVRIAPRQVAVHRDEHDPYRRQPRRHAWCCRGAHAASASCHRSIVRFGIIERLEGDGGEAALRVAKRLGVPARLPAHEEGDLAQFPFSASSPQAMGSPAMAWGVTADGRQARMARRVPLRCPSRPTARHAPWDDKCDGAAPSCEFEILAEHRRGDVPPSPIIRGWTQVSKSTFAPSNPICGEWRAGKSCTWTGRRDDGAGNAEPLGDVAFHLRSQHQLGPERSDRGSSTFR